MPSLPRRITLVRHAMPVVEVASRPGAWPLSAEGVAAAIALDLPAVADFVASPEVKARQTLALALGVAADEIAVDARFREVDRVEAVHGGFREARRAWVAGDLDERHESWEHPDAAARRFHAGLIARPADHLVVGTHGLVLTAWMVAQGRVAPGQSAVGFWEALGFPHLLDLGEVDLIPPS